MYFYIVSVFQSFKLNSEFSKSQGRKEKMTFHVTHTAGGYCAPVFSSLCLYSPPALDHHVRIGTITYLFLPCGPHGVRLCLSALVHLRVEDTVWAVSESILTAFALYVNKLNPDLPHCAKFPLTPGHLTNNFKTSYNSTEVISIVIPLWLFGCK